MGWIEGTCVGGEAKRNGTHDDVLQLDKCRWCRNDSDASVFCAACEQLVGQQVGTVLGVLLQLDAASPLNLFIFKHTQNCETFQSSVNVAISIFRPFSLASAAALRSSNCFARASRSA